MKTPQRFARIDIIRGVAMVAMIVIHAGAYFLNDASVFFIWNSLQFAVVTFIFCSAYLFFKKLTLQTLSPLKFFVKRTQRLLIPYWIYLVVFFILTNLNGEEWSAKSALRYLTLTTHSNDLSWLVVLMITLTPVMLFINYVRNNRFYYLFFSLICFTSSLVFLFYAPPINFKFIMWLPWSLIIIATEYFVAHENKSYFIPRFLTVLLLVFISVLMINIFTNSSLTQYDNKYPPNLYHLSYGLFITALLFRYANKIAYFQITKKTFAFFSRYSYSIYFIHFLVVYAFVNFTDIRRSGVVIFLSALLTTTVVIQYTLIYLKKIFQSTLKSPPQQT